MPSAFLDTNILLYVVGKADKEARKAEIARRLFDDGDFGISLQVLEEFLVNAQKPAFGLGNDEIDAWIADFLEFECDFGDLGLFLDAISLSRRYRLSYWDGAIVASASRLGAKTFYTEDLNHGQSYGSVKVFNPFL